MTGRNDTSPMNEIASVHARPDGLEASVAYLRPDSRINRRYVSPAGQLNLSEYTSHSVFVRNARPLVDHITFESHGFMLTRFRTGFSDFRSRELVEQAYLPEVAGFVKELVGADSALVIDWLARSSAEGSTSAHPPANDVHVDYTPELSEWMARMMLAKANMRDYPFRHFVAINCWRSFTPAPQDWPLGLCDARSVGPEEGAVHGIVHVDAVPRMEDVPETWPDDPSVPKSYDFSAFRFNPAHEWYYFPDMSPDEVLLFKNYDSSRTGAWRVPHAGFKDPGCAATQPRESIEVRVVAFYR
jgi:hypothetical protein